MALAITVTLGSTSTLLTTDHSGRGGPRHPIDPARLCCVLVDAARDPAELAALRWLEAQPAPIIRTSSALVDRLGVGEATAITLTWPNDPDHEVLDSLMQLVRRLPYQVGDGEVAAGLAAEVSVEYTGREKGGGPWEGSRWDPCGLLEAELMVRVPYPGFLAAVKAGTTGRPGWESARHHGYHSVRVPMAAPPLPVPHGDTHSAPSVYPDVVVLRFTRRRPPATATVSCTAALRSAVLSQAGDSAPTVLHGHRADNQPHVAFLALPDAGHPGADGNLLGLAVAIPDLPDEQRDHILAAVLGLSRSADKRLVHLRVPKIGQLELAYQPGHIRPWVADPRRWRQGGTRWTSVTPVVLDRHPKKRDSAIEAEILHSLRRVGLPDPIDLQVSMDSPLPGAARILPCHLPEKHRGKQFRHITVTFDRTVSGPVLVGACRYLGVGLLVPTPSTHHALTPTAQPDGRPTRHP